MGCFPFLRLAGRSLWLIIRTDRHLLYLRFYILQRRLSACKPSDALTKYCFLRKPRPAPPRAPLFFFDRTRCARCLYVPTALLYRCACISSRNTNCPGSVLPFRTSPFSNSATPSNLNPVPDPPTPLYLRDPAFAVNFIPIFQMSFAPSPFLPFIFLLARTLAQTRQMRVRSSPLPPTPAFSTYLTQ